MWQIVVLVAATFVNPTIPDKFIERQAVKQGATYETLLECRDALQHSNNAQGLMSSAVQKLNKFVDEFEQPSGYSLRGKRVRTTCLPTDLTAEEMKATLAE